ncbi:MAG: hypothetical protein AVDCRST_MAG68-4648 [uncultured Gemmatimonadetes bacterium]|uniref:BIG2 domain-containing protein n=1 Tax=uncultured Gemmatimonadota bacterium TaxID=203437 RepID=A0A6J4MPT0_9BACT|nr:MAG: hypothetical protein AVDCRST_MAG68-4648 [uncultured Gemmatimonadota bacterium]
MLRHSFRRIGSIPLVLLALASSSCADSPAGPGATRGDEARVRVSVAVAGTPVAALTAEVTAADLASRLLFNLPIENGVATGSLAIPAGSDRTVTLRAFDAAGIETHRGSKVLSVTGGTNATVSISLLPLTGEQPLSASFGTVTIVMTPQTMVLQQGTSSQFTAVVLDAEGQGMAEPVRWATLNPAVAMVDSLGVVSAVDGGAGARVEIVATARGASGSGWVTVPGDGTQGSTDGTAPRITAFSFTPGALDVSAADDTVEVTLGAADAGAGVASAIVTFRNPANLIGRSCQATVPTGTVVSSATLRCLIILPRHSSAGAWYISTVSVRDRAGNSRSFSRIALENSGYRTRLDVASATPDDIAPVLRGFAFGPDSVAVGTVAQSITFTFATTDEGPSGIQFNRVFIRSPSGATTLSCGGGGTPDSGTPQDGTWNCVLTVPVRAEAGTWTVSSVQVSDWVGNRRTYADTDLQAAGYRTRIRVTH